VHPTLRGAAIVVPHAGRALTGDDVIGHVRDRLASFKKPRHVLFRDELPRIAPTEKVHRALLREMAARAIRL